MKKLFLFIVIGLLAFTFSCSGGSDESDISKAEKMQKKMMEKMGVPASDINEMQKKVRKISENVKKIEKEKAKETDEDKKTFSDKNAELLGLSVTKRKITDSDWQKASLLRDAYKKMPNEQLRELTHEKIEKMIVDAGFSDGATAKNSLRAIADSKNLIIDFGMKIDILKSTRAIDGDEEYKKEMKKLGDKINEKGYSVEDLRTMDKNIKVSASVTEILYRLNH